MSTGVISASMQRSGTCNDDVQVRDVIVVVSRWFGGTLLGPMRFTLINNTARILLEDCGYDKRDVKTSGRSSKKQ
jgi:Uncharacterized protein family UPF0029